MSGTENYTIHYIEGHVTLSSCIDVCSDALEAAKLDGGTNWFGPPELKMTLGGLVSEKDDLPKDRFKQIKKNNKEDIVNDEKLKTRED